MANNRSNALVEHVRNLLDGRGAHVDFATVMERIPVAERGRRPKGTAHSPWEILEHLAGTPNTFRPRGPQAIGRQRQRRRIARRGAKA
jgi:hypothetical protein